MENFNPSEIESSLGVEQSKPIVKTFNSCFQGLQEKQDILDNQQRTIALHQESIDRQQSILDNQKIAIHEIKDSFEEYKNGDLDRKTEIKKDLLIELATKADIEKMNGKIDSLEHKMNGKIDSLEHKMNGKIEKVNGKIDSLEQKFMENSKVSSYG
ncbi:MAG: BdrQ [Candidatus Magnetoglobus multicellularis str. Araruama]|uniref:BdrQ n=1 Tax=Candidatus Magnetoglobus multicellularis str. Araruama TaxID=890399 RepID=A0A1V1PB96_9BACT|nr:MAG: BdrQ [Candidatus Magnetoglobus multicellularis str. Araruama]